MEITQGRVFFKPEPGMYIGTIIDVVDMPKVQTSFGPKDKVRIVWALNLPNGAPALDPEGKQLEATVFPTASMSEKSSQPLFRNLFKIVYSVLNGAPPLISSTQDLEKLLMGRSNGLLLTKEPNPAKPGDFFSNVVGLMPLAPGQIAPGTPQGFVRAKDRVKTQAGPQGRPVQTYAIPQQPQQFQPQQQQQPGQPNTVSFNQPPASNEAF
jgi:hypothetical protein